MLQKTEKRKIYLKKEEKAGVFYIGVKLFRELSDNNLILGANTDLYVKLYAAIELQVD